MLNTNNVPGFESIKLINSKRQRPNLKKLLTKAEFSNEEVGVKKVPVFAMRLLQSHKYYLHANVFNLP